MTVEKIVMWKDPERDEDKEDKAVGLLKHLEQYEVEVVNAFDFTAMVVVKVSLEEAKRLAEDKELETENNGTYCALNDVGNTPGKPRNCS